MSLQDCSSLDRFADRLAVRRQGDGRCCLGETIRLALATGAGFWVAVLARFLVTSSAFSLSSLDRLSERLAVRSLGATGTVAAALVVGLDTISQERKEGFNSTHFL